MDSLANITLLLLSLLLLFLCFLYFFCFFIFFMFFIFNYVFCVVFVVVVIAVVFVVFVILFVLICADKRRSIWQKSMIITILVWNNNLYIKSKLRAVNKNGFQFLTQNSMLFQGIYIFVMFKQFWKWHFHKILCLGYCELYLQRNNTYLPSAVISKRLKLQISGWSQLEDLFV